MSRAPRKISASRQLKPTTGAGGHLRPTYSEAKQAKERIDARVEMLSARLNAFPKGAMGQTSERVKADPAFRAAKQAYAAAFETQRAFNTAYLKTYRNEIAAARQDRVRSLVTPSTTGKPASATTSKASKSSTSGSRSDAAKKAWVTRKRKG